MSVVVFVGPTVRPEEVRAIVEADCRAPAAQGDLYRAALERPRAIGLIDGYFNGVPATWHKEILWAMAKGIAVFGSASMGALRAAELCSFGMRGVGRIFEDYRDGRIEDDDEVAVLHAPAELGFAPLSEPMVSIRATLARAVRESVLSAGSASLLADAAKALHYRDRDWERVLGAVGRTKAPPAELAGFRRWLPDGRVDAKREDALDMLREMARDGAVGADAVGYSFERTHLWDGMVRRVEAEGTAALDELALVLDELRLDAERFEAVRRQAALRELAIADARRHGLEPSRSEVLQEISTHRVRHGLVRRGALTDWLGRSGIGTAEYERLARENRRADAGAVLSADALARHAAAILRWSGEFAPLRRRACEKEAAIAAARPGAGRSRANMPIGLNLALWYFEERLGEDVPEDLDGYARRLGFESRDDFYRMVERERVYCAVRAKDPEDDAQT